MSSSQNNPQITNPLTKSQEPKFLKDSNSHNDNLACDSLQSQERTITIQRDPFKTYHDVDDPVKDNDKKILNSK